MYFKQLLIVLPLTTVLVKGAPLTGSHYPHGSLKVNSLITIICLEPKRSEDAAADACYNKRGEDIAADAHYRKRDKDITTDT